MPKSEPVFLNYLDIAELLDDVKRNEWLWYQGPMDHQPHQVYVQEYTINNEKLEKSTIKLKGTGFDPFRAALTSHTLPRGSRVLLDRFKKKVG